MKQADNICLKVMSTLVYLYQRNQITAETRIKVVQTEVLSIINYLSNVWGSIKNPHAESTQNYKAFL